MGCFLDENDDSKASRIGRWKSTDIVALRDFKLKVFPDEVLDLDTSVRILDLTHNRLVGISMEISKLVNMQRLILADDLVERLLMNLGKFQSLKVITLDGKFPSMIFLLENGFSVNLHKPSKASKLQSFLHHSFS